MGRDAGSCGNCLKTGITIEMKVLGDTRQRKTLECCLKVNQTKKKSEAKWLLEVGSVDRQLPVVASVQLGGQTLLDQLLLGGHLEKKSSAFEDPTRFSQHWTAAYWG